MYLTMFDYILVLYASNLNFWDTKNSHRTKSGKYGGLSIVIVGFFVINSVIIEVVSFTKF